MITVIAALISGLLFGLGLSVSHMIDPAKVIGFLDVAGDWDPSLALVMGGAVTVMAGANLIKDRRRSPLLSPAFALPTRADIDRRLVAGSGLFGVGWGLVGFCPGPAFSALSLGEPKVWVFTASMLAGFALFELAEKLREDSSAATCPPCAAAR